MAEEKYLNESGLLRFWNTKIKPLIYRKATLQQDLVVNNPRVTVDLPNGYTFQKGSTMEDLFRYLYIHDYEEVQPNLTAQKPTVTLKVTVASDAEVGDDVTYTVQKKSFNEGKIGTCEAPFFVEAHQTRVDSGSTEKANTFKIYSGSSNKPAQCTTLETLTDGKVTGTLHIEAEGTNNIGTYYSGQTQYYGSTATSYTSHQKVATVSGVSSFPEGTTDKSACVTGSTNGYYPSFGNISFSSTETSSSTIINLGNTMNSTTSAEGIEFYYGPTDTRDVVQTPITFEIYFPATLSCSVQYKDPITGAWTDVPSTVTSGHFAKMPAKDTTANYPNGNLQSGKEYKLVRQASGYKYGSRRYRLILS